MKSIITTIAAILCLVATVSAQNNPPVFTILNDTTISEGDTLKLNIEASDDEGDYIYIFTSPLPSNVVFQQFANGLALFDFFPWYDQAGEDTITFFATDSINDSVSMEIHIVVNDYNPPPQLDSIGNHRIVEGDTLSLAITASDPDGIPPILTVSDTLLNATFEDFGNGQALFVFNPDETQFGSDSLEYVITFFAEDGVNTVSEEDTIWVVGPNQSPVVDSIIGGLTVDEGDTMIVNIYASDPNGTYPEISHDPVLNYASIIDIEQIADNSINATYRFVAPFIHSNSAYIINFYIFDHNLADTAIHAFQVIDIGNNAPVFDPVDTARISEGQQLIIDISAVDPEGEQISLWMADSTEPHTTFEDHGNGTGTFTFEPDLTQGGFYGFEFVAADSVEGDPDARISSYIVNVDVLEIDNPPILEAVGSPTIDEGRLFIDTIFASDIEQVPVMSLTIPPETQIYLDSGIASVEFIELAPGMVLFEFYPTYYLVEENNLNLQFTFNASDSVETISETITITINDISKETSNDPGITDTLTLLTSDWWDRGDTLILTCRLWNDSAIAAGITAFRWNDTGMICQEVQVSPFVDTAFFKLIKIYPESLLIDIEFLFNDSMFFPPSPDTGQLYFTAKFTYDTIPLPQSGTRIVFDTTKIGSSGDFAFDKRLRPKSFTYDDWKISKSSDFTYQPLVIVDEVRAAYDSVAVAVYDEYLGRYLEDGDTIWAGINQVGEAFAYQLRISMENDDTLTEMQLGVEFNSIGEVEWLWDAQPGIGLGTLEAVTIPAGVRMGPHTEIWNQSIGLQVNEINMDGISGDSLVLFGQADGSPGSGFPPGILMRQISTHFIPQGSPGMTVDSICISLIADSISYLDINGNISAPGIAGPLCFPVFYKNLSSIEDQDQNRPEIFSLSQNYPNPFNPSTVINFSLGRRGHTTLNIYNILGQLVRSIVDDELTAGQYSVIWDGRDRSGRSVASGIYLYRFVTKEFSKTRKMLLLR